MGVEVFLKADPHDARDDSLRIQDFLALDRLRAAHLAAPRFANARPEEAFAKAQARRWRGAETGSAGTSRAGASINGCNFRIAQRCEGLAVKLKSFHDFPQKGELGSRNSIETNAFPRHLKDARHRSATFNGTT
jgi:hypothetical protein